MARVPLLPVLPAGGHASEFRGFSVGDFDAADLAARKRASGLTVSLCLPARNEEQTVGHIVATVRRTLVEAVPLVDEIIVVDDGSTDATGEAARWEGARVLVEAEVLPETGPGSGKGNAMWKSLYAANGDLVCWADADIRNFGPHFVTGLLGPLLTHPSIDFVKGYYERPLDGDPTGGGRVTELVARPLISVLFPQLAGFLQPLSGEYAGRRSALERVPFVQGWGVELALLLDLVALLGPDAIAQVDLGIREHRNRPLDELAPQATAILVTALRRAGMPDERVAQRARAELLRFDADLEPEAVPVEVRERPPISTLAAYRAKFGLGLSA
jgi:glucosyl-3-phosphoglycerate synthase